MGKEEKKYLKTLKKSIDESTSETYEELLENFGQPDDLIASYYEREDSFQLVKKIRYKKYIKMILVVFLISALIIVGFILKRYIDSRNSDIDNLEVVIHKE